MIIPRPFCSILPKIHFQERVCVEPYQGLYLEYIHVQLLELKYFKFNNTFCQQMTKIGAGLDINLF